MSDLDAIARRSRRRIVAALPTDEWACPFCGRPLAVRRTQIGHVGPDGARGYIDGVAAKCAGEGCGFRPNFDVPLREGRGYWPELTGREEFERERELRGGDRGIDVALSADAADGDVRDRLRALGYLADD